MLNVNILFFTRTMGLGGTEKIILQLCEALQSDFNKIVVCSSGGVHESRLNELGIKHYSLPDIQDKKLLVFFKVFFLLFKIVYTEKIHIIHSHHRMAAFYSIFVSLFCRCKIMYTAHNVFNDKILLYRNILKKNSVVAVGSSVRDNMVDVYGMALDKITVIQNAVGCLKHDMTLLKELVDLRTRKKFLVGNFGRLSEQKGMEYFIEAANILKDRGCDNIGYVIVGDGELYCKLRNLVDLFGLKRSFVFLGYRNDIQNIMSQVDLVVLSSLWEGFPLIPIEAFSVGKAVVGTNIDGTPEIIEHNQNGMLIKPRCPEDIAESIFDLYVDAAKLQKLETNALNSFKSKYSIENFSKNYKKYYLSLLRGEVN